MVEEKNSNHGQNSSQQDQYLIDEFKLEESWRIFKIISEFVEGFEKLAKVDRAVTIFGSARTPEEHEDYRQAWYLGNMLAKAGITMITGGGPGTSTTVLSYMLYSIGWNQLRFGRAAALALMIAVVNWLLITGTLRLTRVEERSR